MYLAYRFTQSFRGLGFFGECLCKMSLKKRSKRRGSQETERVSTRARSPEVDELSCVPETSAGSWGGGVGGGSGGSSGDVGYRTE